MNVLLYSDLQNLIENSGIGRAKKHQIMALEAEGIDYTLNPKDSYDILHINTIFPQSYLRADIAKKSGKAVVYHAHSTEEDFKDSFLLSNAVSPAFKSWIKLCYSTADLILTPTEYSKELLQRYGMNKPIEVVSNGIDIDYWKCTEKEKMDFRKKYDIREDEKLIISVGLQIKRKGIIDFVEMAKMMPEYKFIWFGYTKPSLLPEETLKAVNTKLPNLLFAGYVDRDELRVAYNTADLYLFPTYEETEGIVLLEALASKTNVLVRDIPVFGHPYEDGENLYKAKNLNEFILKTESILNGNLPNLSEKGYLIAKNKNIKKVGEKLRDYYELALEYSHRT
ncbi:MAG: glycosyltransferase [Tissierellia bacterium]|nr:glycosyltransferase [Tissierellia bacterium]